MLYFLEVYWSRYFQYCVILDIELTWNRFLERLKRKVEVAITLNRQLQEFGKTRNSGICRRININHVTDHMTPKFLFNINFTVKITNCVKWSLNIHSENRNMSIIEKGQKRTLDGYCTVGNLEYNYSLDQYTTWVYQHFQLGSTWCIDKSESDIESETTTN